MKLRVVISVLILVSVLVLGIFTVTLIKDFCGELIKLTDQAGESMSINILDSVKDRWNKKANILSALIPHEHVDEVTLSISRAHAFLVSGNEDEYKAEIAEIIRQLEVVKRYDFPNMRSIF